MLSVAPPKRWVTFIPAPRLVFPVIGFTAVDTLAAASIIFVFIPEGYLPFLTLFSAFLIAFGAGMISGLPGGIGAFELCLVGMLAPVDPAPLLSAILAFRIIYYAVPAIAAGLSLIKAPQPIKDPAPLRIPQTLPRALARYAPPEADLTTQNLLQTQCNPRGEGAALWHRARNCDVVLGNIFGPVQKTDFLRALMQNAKHAGRGLCLYKCNAEDAKHAAQHQFITFKIGSEALIKPVDFNTEGSRFRQLRRKLRHAKKGGIAITEDALEYGKLAQIDVRWQERSGAALGFSMGYLSQCLLARQRVFVANIQGAPIAFITVLTGSNRWVLDIMRVPADCPDGTAHALVIAAIDAARSEQIDVFSLAAAPLHLPSPEKTLSDRFVGFLFSRNAQLKGLTRFKASFTPEWQPNYLAASGPLTLCYAMLDLWQLIRRKHEDEPNLTTRNMHLTHDHYGFYEFASGHSTCHALRRMTSKEDPHEPDR